MINNKRGLSTVVTTLIIILLVLVAIGIIWIVIRGVIETGTESIDYSVKCLKVDVSATAVNCSNPVACVVTLSRKAGGDAIEGVKFVFYNATGGGSGSVEEDVGNIEPLTTKVATVDSGVGTPNKVAINAFFEDAKGQDQVCTQTNEFSF